MEKPDSTLQKSAKSKPTVTKTVPTPKVITKPVLTKTVLTKTIPNKPAPETAKLTPLESAIAKYIDCGWTIMRTPAGSINDFIASGKDKLHFVQVITKETCEDSRFHGEAKNAFVQNAFSNSALPIFAHVVSSRGATKVTFEDVNMNSRVLLRAAKK